MSKGKVLSEYIGSGPPKNTGLHRYVFLLYRQRDIIDFSKVKYLTNQSGEGRGNFSIKKFARDHDLGTLIAGNMFLAEYDDYVPILMEQLKGSVKK